MNEKRSPNLPLPVRTLLYLLGMLILALGLVLNTKTALGVAPIISVAYCVSVLCGISFGDASFAWYSLFVFVVLFLHRRQFRTNRKLLILDLLQFPVFLVFTRVMNLLSALLPTLSDSLPPRILTLACAVICIGVGAALVLKMRMVPGPGDGIVQAIADCVKKPVGNVKNCFDLSCVVISILLSLAIAHRIIGVGAGTVAAALFTGRVMALFNRLTRRW